DYFVIGILGIGTGPIAYLFFKWIYGGMAKVDADKFPLNPKSKLAMGDVIRISYYWMISGTVGIVGRFFLGWFEGDWGEEYYLDVNGEGFFGNFEAMLNVLLIGSIISLAIGVVLFFIGKKVNDKLEQYPGSYSEDQYHYDFD
ncbi:MAG: hypothetical protein RBT05_07860, partial [Bacteroidales bacterium]|nr:hypothetical protein [Bacteroidales bacterium]